jgi:glycosyltransferase involved in cell wall biosynthesis
MKKIVIGIPTYKRPESIKRALKSIAKQKIDTKRYALSVIVADNEPSEITKKVITGLKKSFPFPLTYIEEPARGLSYVRNALLKAAGKCDAILFMDDDETAAPNWAAEMLKGKEEFSADIVKGKAKKLIPQNASRWVTSSYYFDEETHPRGKELEEGYTNNLLIDATIWREWNIGFDPRFAFIGGEDTDFTIRAKEQGAKIVFIPEAVVSEHLEDVRLNFFWLLKRAIREGTHFGIIKTYRDQSAKNYFMKAARFSLGTAYWFFGIVWGGLTCNRKMISSCFSRLIFNASALLGMLNISLNEYGK